MIHEILIDGERLIPGTEGRALIASKSTSGAWHLVSLDACDCKGFAHHQRCRHVRALASYLNVDAPPVAVRRPQPSRPDPEEPQYCYSEALIEDEPGYATWLERKYGS